ncbi:MAG: riboflavin biosynthesis protein RibF [Clostridia bacterium]|nr:riboflavin biosynthesis protein RibF [Clostridia bacterium]
MDRIQDRDHTYVRKNVVILGTFDGLHLAHRKLISIGVEMAEEHEMDSLIYTFTNIPGKVLGKESDMIMDPEEKAEAFKETGVDHLFMTEFDEELARTGKYEFMQFLTNSLNAGGIVAGANFRFGKDAAGGKDDLIDFCRIHGLLCFIVDDITDEYGVISSSRVREHLRRGEMEKAGMLMGSPFFYYGKVEHGFERGKTMGYPTINLYPSEGKIVPPYGVYFSITYTGERKFYGLTNVGVRPTLADSERLSVETHLFDFDEDLYGENVKVCLCHFTRPEIRFSDIKELSDRIGVDEAFAKQYFGL